MSMERAAMRGKLSEAEDKKRRLELRIEGDAEAIRTGLNTALTPAAELPVPMLAEQWSQLTEAWGELQAVILEVERLKRGLA